MKIIDIIKKGVKDFNRMLSEVDVPNTDENPLEGLSNKEQSELKNAENIAEVLANANDAKNIFDAQNKRNFDDRLNAASIQVKNSRESQEQEEQQEQYKNRPEMINEKDRDDGFRN